MNRTLINSLSVVIFAILACTVFLPLAGFLSGIFDTTSEPQPVAVSAAQFTEPVVIGLNPDAKTLLNPVDTIGFENGEAYPVAYKEAIMLLPEKKALGWTDTLFMIGYILNVVFFILLLIDFAKFIININKNKIFEIVNAKLLRRCALWLALMTVSSILSYIAEEVSVANLNLTLAGYELSAVEEFPWSTLLFSAITLLTAKVWSRGIELREEQKLTI